MQLSDEELMVRCARGDSEAFSELYRRYRRKLKRYIGNLLGDEELAKDVLQEVFLRAFKARGSYKPRAKFSAWIYTIATNLCRDELRRRLRYNVTSIYESLSIQNSEEGEEETFELYETIVDGSILPPDQELERKENEKRFRKALESLSNGHREVLEMRLFEGLKYAEISRRLNIPSGTVKSRIHYAIKALKRALKEG
jgi:RNA polymerase sigma-70 factor (ECF subfamily)